MKTTPKRLILCVDADDDALSSLEAMLAGGGYDTLASRSGHEALKFVHNIKPDLIVVDVSLPDMDGYEFCAKLQADHEIADIPIVLELPPGQPQDKAKAVSAGAVDYVEKPVRESTLLKKAATHSQTKRLWKKLKEGSGVWRRGSMRSKFPGFKKFLARELKLSSEGSTRVRKVTTSRLYVAAGELGISPEGLAHHVAAYLGLSFLPEVQPDDVELGVLPSSYCRANFVVPVRKEGQLAFVLSNPFDWQLLANLGDVASDGPLQLLVTAPQNITKLFEQGGMPAASSDSLDTIPAILRELQKRYTEKPTGASTENAPAETSEPIIALVNQIIEHGYEMGGSDIHIEPWEDQVVVRYRLDGELRIVNRLKPKVLIRPLVSRLKIMSGLDISERRLPQDGRIVYKEFSSRNLDFDLRVATAPMNFGEKVVMRIVDKEKSVLPLTRLGFSNRHLKIYRQEIRSPYGMVLHVGPTGSGKSMTLYAALNEVARPEVNIQTAEDPIEYTLPGINQLQVNPNVGLTFGRALRSYLRQDPDIILIGEIRDLETVEIATEAALTGHLLLSTMHTNDAASTVTRLVQMGIEPFLVSSSIVLVCAQRLLRRLCESCRRPHTPNDDEKTLVGVPPERELTLYRAPGCSECNGVGYKGRIGVHEILVPDDSLRLAINKKGVSAEALKRMAVETCGMTTLYWDAMEKVRGGVTSVQEVFARVRGEPFDSRPAWMFEELGIAPARNASLVNEV